MKFGQLMNIAREILLRENEAERPGPGFSQILKMLYMR